MNLPYLERRPSSDSQSCVTSGRVELHTWVLRSSVSSPFRADCLLTSCISLPGAGPNIICGLSRAQSPGPVFYAHLDGRPPREWAHLKVDFQVLPSDHDVGMSARLHSLEDLERRRSIPLARLGKAVKPVLLETMLAAVGDKRGAQDRQRMTGLSIEELLLARPFVLNELFVTFPWLLLVNAELDLGFGRDKYAFVRKDLERVVHAEVRG